MAEGAEESARRSFVVSLKELKAEGKNVEKTLEKAEKDWRASVKEDAKD